MFFTPYKHLVGYLERWSIVKIDRLHVRIHHIKRNDATPYLHSHPFSYLSFVFSGGYVEDVEGKEVVRKRFSVALRSNKTFHRIKSVEPQTKTLFITWKSKEPWALRHSGEQVEGWIHYPKGVYKRTLWGKEYFCKFDGYWYEGKATYLEALLSNRPSIDQTSHGELAHLGEHLAGSEKVRGSSPLFSTVSKTG